MEIKFLAPAEAEFLNAISFYNTQSEGLVMNLLRKSIGRFNELFSIPKLGLNFQNAPVVAELIDSHMVLFIRL